MAPTIFRLMLLLGIGLAAVDVAEAGTGPKVITIMRFPQETFTSDLLNSTTTAYQNLTARIEDKVFNALKGKNANITALKVNGYTNGSIIVNSTVELDSTVDPATVNVSQLVKNATIAVANDATFTTFKIDNSTITTTATTVTTTATTGTTTATTTTAAGGTTTTAAGGTTTTAAGATTTHAAGATTTAAAGATTVAPGATTAAAGATTAAAGATTAAAGATTAAAGATTAAAGGSVTSGSSGGASGTSGSSSTGTTSSNSSSTVNTTAKIPAKVDETGLGGMGVIIAVTKTSLPSVAPYLDITKPEYGYLMGALPALNNMLKGTSEAPNILTNVQLKQVIAEDSATIRAEYLAQVSINASLPPIQAGMDALNKKDVFKIDGTTHKVEFVPLTVPNRWHSLRLRLTNKVFVPEMKDPSYAQFKGLQTEIQQVLSDLLRSMVPAVRQAYIEEFISGSVIVRTSVETDNTSSSATTNNLANALSTVDTLGPYTVDTDPKTKSATDETYLYGAYVFQPVPASQLPVRVPLTRDNENIKNGQVSIEDPANQVPIKRTNYFFTVTIPSFAAVLVLIVLFLCCTTSDSCLCKICSNEPKSVP